MNNIFNEYEALWNRVQNLNLYMEYIRVNYPDAFEACADCRNRPIPAKVAQVLGIEPVRITTIKQSP